MRFWDSSAVVPLCVTEPRSAIARSLLEEDPALVVWWAARTECLSALTRRSREGELSSAGLRAARRVLAALDESWLELQPSEAIRTPRPFPSGEPMTRIPDELVRGRQPREAARNRG